MTARTQVGLLGDNAVRPDTNRRETIEYHIIADPAIVPNLHFPGIGESGARANHHTLPNLCPKQAQQSAARRMVAV